MSENIIEFFGVEFVVNDKIPPGEVRFISSEVVKGAKYLALLLHPFFTSEKDALDYFLSIAPCDTRIINIESNGGDL